MEYLKNLLIKLKRIKEAKQMIEERYIVGNHTSNFLMPRNNIETKC